MPAVAAVTNGCDVRHNARTESRFAERWEGTASCTSLFLKSKRLNFYRLPQSWRESESLVPP